ncbi:MAG: transcription elongation factor GreA [Planctomycetia bacterium]|nr:transcription elongation factor GreA [Planctomycetia bacterium]
MSDQIPMTREGYARLKKEIERLENEVMPPILERLANARAEGDLRENAEYHGARESQGLVQAKINDLKSRLGRALIIDPSTVPHDEIRFGARIVIEDIEEEETMTYTLVGAGDDDPEEGRILCTCPLALGLLGKKVGEIAEVKVPAGLIKYKILEISYDI